MNNRPIPTSTSTIEGIDTLGHSKTMTVQRWSWLIAKTNVSDQQLIEWAQSFNRPPSIELEGATLEFESYAPERRAIRIRVTQPTATLLLKPVARYVNPVLELTNLPGKLTSVTYGEHPLARSDYAWDGHTLWLNVKIDRPTRLTLHFE